MSKSDVIASAIGLIILASGIFFGRSVYWAYFLVVVAAVVLWIVFARDWLSHIPKVHVTRDSASAAAEHIYELAAENGGEIIATHIQPGELSASEDYAVHRLRRVKRHLRFRRFLLVADKRLEEQWLENTCEELKKEKEVDATVYVVRRPIFVGGALWAVLPRANLLLYKSENEYRCILGLDRLVAIDSEDEGPVLNFAIEFRSRNVFEILSRYFESLIASGNIQAVKDFGQYKKAPRSDFLKPQLQGILNGLITLGENTPQILHVGVFGGMADHLSGLQSMFDYQEHEADLDLMVVTEREERDVVKEKLLQLFHLDNVELVWGDDPHYFYHFRPQGKITVDVEVHERGADFYEKHPLLGCSIFAHYYMVYQVGERHIASILKLPRALSSSRERYKVLIEDRKGLVEFEERLGNNTSRIDPRRAISICLRNVMWANSGVRLAGTSMALDSLAEQWERIFPGTDLSRVREVLQMDQKVIRDNYKESRRVAESLVANALEFGRKQIEE